MNARRILGRGSLVAAAVVLSACRAGGPTSIHFSGAFARVTFSGAFRNSSGTATITEFKVLLDGKVIEDDPFTPAVSEARLNAFTPGSLHGTHRLSLVAAGQTSSPSSYQTDGIEVAIFGASGSLEKTMTLPPLAGSLATGPSIDYDISF